MAKFAQYFLEYVRDGMLSQLEWGERQSLFAAFFETDESIDFSLGEGEGRKTYKHDVYHLSANRDIIVMRIADAKTKEVIQDFMPVDVRHEPPCYVIIDNRDRCRRIAIQRRREAFGTTDSLRKILSRVLNNNMLACHHIGIRLHPQYYPRDFYKAWRLHQNTTQSLRFNFGEGTLPADVSDKNLSDESMSVWADKMCEEMMHDNYRATLELNPPEDRTCLPVDESSVFIRNLVNFSASTGSSIEIVTTDGARFRCFVDDEGESDSIVTSEIETQCLDALFPKADSQDSDEAQEVIRVAEGRLVEFVNAMKVEAQERDGKEDVA